MNYLNNIIAQQSNPIKSMSDSFRSTSELQYGLLLSLFAIIGIIVLIAIIVKKLYFHNSEDNISREYKLFEDILDQLQLTRQEKETLRTMAREARLKQPAMCLVTPSLMEKSKELWLREKGQKLVKDGKIKILNDIAYKLHDYSLS